MTDDRHLRHELRRSRFHVSADDHDTVPSRLDVDVPPIPNWARPVPRLSRGSSTPLITWNRTHKATRLLCEFFPRLIPAARRIF